MIGSSIIDLVKEEAERMYNESGYLNLWMLARRVGFSTEIIKRHLWKLGFVEDELRPGRFIRKEDGEKVLVKESF